MGWYLEAMALAFWLVIGTLVLVAIVVFAIDRFQTADAIRRNYPVIGRFRGLFSELGEFFRQYFFAMDREELPFNRAQRDWVKHASSGKSNTIAFGRPAISPRSARPFSPHRPFRHSAANTPPPSQW